jgi:hypothetical protein
VQKVRRTVPVFARIFLLQYLAETGALSQEVIPAKKKLDFV